MQTLKIKISKSQFVVQVKKMALRGAGTTSY
jgi:hypothetical protein